MGAQRNLFDEDDGTQDSQPYSASSTGQAQHSEKYADAVTIKCEVLVPPQIVVSKTGKEFSKFACRDLDIKAGRGTFGVVCFKGACETSKKLKVGDKITVSGSQDKKSETGLMVWGIHLPGEQKAAISPKARIIREYGSLEAYRDAEKRNTDFQLAAGRVRVTRRDGLGTDWLNKDDCCEYRGVWTQKIDALCEEYGDGVIKAEIMAIVSKSPKLNIEPTRNGFSKPQANWTGKYKAWKEERVRVMLGLPKEDLFP